MAFTYTTRNGSRVEVNVAAAFDRMAAAFRAATGCDLLVTDGTRTRAEQQYLHNGWINRLPGFNLAAAPGFSNHEENNVFGTGPRALDLRDSGSDAGVTVIGSARSNWLAANAPRFGFRNAGHFFSPREGWHYEYTGSLGGSAPSGGTSGASRNATSRPTADVQRVVGANPDGVWGSETESKVKAWQSSFGLDADGIWGPASDAVAFLTIDGSWGEATTRRVQRAFGVPVDGAMGPVTWTAIQKHLKITADGIPGQQTYRALQRALGVTADGQFGTGSTTALQQWLVRGGVLVPIPEPAAPVTPPTIEAAVSRTPVYPKAVRGWSVPLGQGAREAGSKITHLIVHHTTSTGSDEAYFKTANDRSSCPTWYVQRDGSAIEMIAPGKRPSATGKANTYSVAIETQNTSGAPAWGISEASHETIAQIAAWLFSFNGKTLDGVPIEFTLDRQHVIGHNEAGVNATVCPGPSMNLDKIVARAKEIAAGSTPPITPEPGDETIPVSRNWLQQLLDTLKKLLGQ